VTERISPLHIVVLAAGKGTRMKSSLPKVLHRLAGLPLITHVLRIAARLEPASTLVVVGYEADEVRRAAVGADGVTFVLQEPQLGTGHALLQAEPALAGKTGTLLLLSGDVPLLQPETLLGLLAHHRSSGAVTTVLTTRLDQPCGYGRIVRAGGLIERIVEERDATPGERGIHEVNTGIYAFELAPLFEALRGLARENSQGEYYLPDLIAIHRQRGLPVETKLADDATEVRGVNSRAELAELAAVVRRRRNEALMEAGVTLVDPATIFVDMDADVGPDTVLYPNVFLEGWTRVGARCQIHAGTRIVDSTVGEGTVVLDHCLIRASTIASNAVIGPFAHIRPESVVEEGAHVGNFVELKKTRLGRASKANHLTYLGDATVGERVNVGAGTITCNYDGTAKHRTTIEDGAFIGSDTQLIAPVRVGRGAYVAAGSSVTEDVPPGALAIARARQVNKDGWVQRKRAVKTST
jgi:bifunctional UDP-N-acetylglucosamine pyrophosphorylase/glucosamine-1-phosphate N-acetyltransferase